MISQQTREGSTVYRGDSVSYTVSKGPEMVTVPDASAFSVRKHATSSKEPGSPSRKT